jgi:hypothetical protein
MNIKTRILTLKYIHFLFWQLYFNKAAIKRKYAKSLPNPQILLAFTFKMTTAKDNAFFDDFMQDKF